MAAPLKFKWDRGFYFAHAPYGMWSIEQHRGRFLMRLTLAGAHRGGDEQDFGSEPTAAKAQAAVNRAHRALVKLD